MYIFTEYIVNPDCDTCDRQIVKFVYRRENLRLEE